MALIRPIPSKETPYPDSINAYNSSNKTGIVFQYLPSQNIAGKSFKVELTTAGSSPTLKQSADGTATTLSFDTVYTVPSFSSAFQIVMESSNASSAYRVVWY